MSIKILHVGTCDKFIPPFIQFIKDNFKFEDHEFMLARGMAEDQLIDSSNITLAGKSRLSRINYYKQVAIEMHRADKIIIHSFLDFRLVQILFFSPWLLKKCYWIIWGIDLYTYKLHRHSENWERREFFRRPVIKIWPLSDLHSR